MLLTLLVKFNVQSDNRYLKPGARFRLVNDCQIFRSLIKTNCKKNLREKHIFTFKIMNKLTNSWIWLKVDIIRKQ